MSVAPTSELTTANVARRREIWIAALACLAVAAVHLAIAAHFGALGVSRNDDWVYYRVAFRADAGEGFVPDPATRTMLVGLILLAKPVMAVFGPSIASLQVMVSLLGALGLWTTWFVLRSYLPTPRAALAVSTLALGPLYGSLSTTFMSDIPAFAVQSSALACATVALGRRKIRWPWLAASLALCFAAFTIREYAVVAMVAIVACAFARKQLAGRDRVVLAGLSVVWLLAGALLYRWRTGIVSGADQVVLSVIPDPSQLSGVPRTIYTVSLLVAPAVAVALTSGAWARVRRHPGFLLFASIGALTGALVARGDLLLGNYVTQFGSYPETVSGPVPVAVHPVVWGVVLVVAVASTAVVLTLLWSAAALLRDSASRRSLVTGIRRAPVAMVLSAAFVAITLTTVLLLSLGTGERIFDRYVLPAIPFASGLVLWSFPSTAEASRATVAEGVGRKARYRSINRGRWAAVVLSVFLALIGTGLVMGSASLDGAKWRMGASIQGRGYPAATIDAGLEWFGLHQPGNIVVRPVASSAYSPWVTRFFDAPHVCAVVFYNEDVAPPQTDGTPTSPPILESVQVWMPLSNPFHLDVRRADLDCPL